MERERNEKKPNMFNVGDIVKVNSFGDIMLSAKIKRIDKQYYDDAYGYMYDVVVDTPEGKKKKSFLEATLCNWNNKIRQFSELHPTCHYAEEFM